MLRSDEQAFWPVWLSPVQMGPRNDLFDRPERRLVLAVLMDALELIERGCMRNKRTGREAHLYSECDIADARQWFASDERHFMSFLYVCDVLGSDPETVREMIREKKIRLLSRAKRCLTPQRMTTRRRQKRVYRKRG